MSSDDQATTEDRASELNPPAKPSAFERGLRHQLEEKSKQLKAVNKTVGKQGTTIHLLRAELAEVRELNSKVERGELRRLQRFEETAQEQFALDKERLERAHEHIAALEEKLAAKDES